MAKPALEVYLDKTLAGTLLRKDNGNLQFRYDKDYAEAKGPPLSLNLPVRTDAFSHRDCLAFFGNLLPEEDIRAQVALTTGISASNDYRLLYYSPAPSLAPLYDLLSTAVYGELATRLAMSIDGAGKLEDVDSPAWARLAEEAGVAPRFLGQRMEPFLDQVLNSAGELARDHEFAAPLVEKIVAGIEKRAKRLRR